jgi:hypothetical protein
MGKPLLISTPAEPLSLKKKLPCFDDLIELDVFLVSALNIGVDELINYFLFNKLGPVRNCNILLLDVSFY